MTNPFDIVNQLSYTKEDPFRSGENIEEIEKNYKPFLINKTMSYHQDSIYEANDMNENSHLDSLLQSDYYINTLRKRKRYARWIKPETSVDLEAVVEYFGFGRNKALDALKVLSEDEITMIHKRLYKGGISNEQRKHNKKSRRDKT